MSQFFQVHPTHPQARLIERAAQIIRDGGVAVYPTDSTYALGCHIGDARALDRIRQIRRLTKTHLLTLLCRDLAEISTYAQVDNTGYRIIKRYTPGPYTFVLKATRDTPRRLFDPKRRTIGLRVPANAIALALLTALDEPMLTTTLIMPGEDLALADAEEIRDRLEHSVDVIVDGGTCGQELTTVVDLTKGNLDVVRQGIGAV